MNENYRFLIDKLDQFIRRYYKNQIIRGIIYSVALLLLFFLVISLLEYLGHFGIMVRTILFYGFMAGIAFILGKFIAVPMFKLYRIGQTISHEQAAEIIGKHFPEIRDKLLNTLQLHRIREAMSKDLIEASINQRIKHLRPVPFHMAVNIRENRRYIKYALFPLAILLVLLVASPGMIKEPTQRIVRHRVYFERELPFSVWIENDELKALKNEDFLLTIGVSGEEIPDEMYLEMEGQTLKLTRERNFRFHYLFRNVQRNIRFHILADRYRSEASEILVIPRPLIERFEISVDNPSYTGKKDEVLENRGDIIVPEGARVTWKFFTTDTDSLLFCMDGEQTMLKLGNKDVFEYERLCTNSGYYSVHTMNAFVKDPDSLFYTVTVVPDLYPSILVEEYRDSIYDNRLYFRGNIKDDYGFTHLYFKYEKKGMDAKAVRPADSSYTLGLNAGQTQQAFYHFFDVTSIPLAPGDEIDYYFEVWDNDAVNGSKAGRTARMTFRVPSMDEIEDRTEEANETIKDEMETILMDLNSIQKEMEDLHRKLIENENLTWQEQQKMEQLLERQQDLQQSLEDIKMRNIEKAVQEQQYKEVDPELLEKQRELERLFEEILTDDIKKLFEELQKMMDQLDKEKINEMLERMKWANEDIEEQLDRSLELFKRLEFEKKLAETIDKLDKLAEEQEELAEETDQSRDASTNDLIGNQEKIEEKFDQISKDLDELQELNQDLEDPNKLEDTDDEEQGIKEDIELSKGELEQNKRNKASKSQKSASDKMKKLSSSLMNMMSAIQSQSLGEDIWKLREILENLIQISFDQEDLMDELRITGRNSPKYNEIVQEQKKIRDDLVMVEDSLFALSKRQSGIQPIVQREINQIDNRIEMTLDDMVNKRVNNALANQQYVMTSVNNLALLLAEALQNMQEQMSQMNANSQGGASCPNPGSGSPSMSNMRQLQEQLNRQLEQLKRGMEQGKGNQPMGMPSWSEQLARMAAQQEAIRQQMQQYMEGLKEQGIGDDGDMRQMIEDMERTETDIVNKMITEETLMRQKEIMTRLLESEKAERMREMEEKRESEEAKSQKISNPEEFFKYKGLKDNQTELLRSIPPTLKPFYKRKVNEYLFNFDE